MDEREAYTEQARARLNELEAQIDLLQAKAESATADAKAEYLDTVKDLRSRGRELKEKIDDLAAAGEEAWSALRNGIDTAAGDLTQSLDKARHMIESAR
jgi:hypothetical protein